MSEILGLPFNTWIIVGGLFISSALSPLIIAIIIIKSMKRKGHNNE